MPRDNRVQDRSRDVPSRRLHAFLCTPPPHHSLRARPPPPADACRQRNAAGGGAQLSLVAKLNP
eukprot:6175123-Pleurochrysis_carterae.AAC.2